MTSSKSNLNGRVVFITGAASGIGAATALEVVAMGGTPVLVDCDAELLAQIALRCGLQTLHWVADVTDLQTMQEVVEKTMSKTGRIDIVFANAGVAAFGPMAYIDPAAWKRCLEVNVFGVFNTIRAALPSVMAQKGYVLINASSSSFAHPPVMSGYAASKSAVEAMGNSLRIEMAAHAVGVGVVHAGWVRTPLVTEGALHPGFVRLRATMPGPLNSETSPEETARIIVQGMMQRKRRIWVPGWLKVLFALRALLHMPFAERELLRAAPEIESIYLEGLEAEGALASSFGPRERERTLARAKLQD
ncbi:MAG: short-chain dehydrogenase/reductase [Burkholderiales bacterium]|nr:short-chain dehydrogenase/reductase [Burkholderiales bacterium]